MSEGPQYRLTMRFGHSFTDHRSCPVVVEGGDGSPWDDVPSLWPLYAAMAVGFAVNPSMFLVAFAISFAAARARS